MASLVRAGAAAGAREPQLVRASLAQVLQAALTTGSCSAACPSPLTQSSGIFITVAAYSMQSCQQGICAWVPGERVYRSTAGGAHGS